MSFIFGDKPTPPDPTQTANAQQQYNTQAATTQNQVNSYNQSNPYGNLNYVADPSSPSGYRINTSLSAPLQSLFNTQTGTANDIAGTARTLAGNSAGMYSSPYDLNAASGATTKLLNNWSSNYVQPIFDQQSSNLEAQLRNQGLAPGTAAYDNAKNLLARNQGDVTNQYLQQNQGQAFDQALKSYQTPLQTLSGLESTVGGAAGTIPGSPTFAPSPTAQIQPANYAGIAEQNYKQQMDNYNANVNAFGQVASAAGGTIFKGISGGWGGGGGMFGNSPSYGPITLGGPNGPTPFS